MENAMQIALIPADRLRQSTRDRKPDHRTRERLSEDQCPDGFRLGLPYRRCV